MSFSGRRDDDGRLPGVEQTGRRDAATREVGAYFDAVATRYDAAGDSAGLNGYTLRTRYTAVLELLGDRSGRVLDAGMGPGRLCAELDGLGWSVFGVDASPAMVRLARERLPHARERLLVASVERLPLSGESFDAVVATGVLDYVGEPRDAFTEFARVLRPGGLAVVSFPNTSALHVRWRHHVFYPAVRTAKRFHAFGAPPPRRRPLYPRRQIEAMLVGAGLKLEAVRYVACLALPAPLDSMLPSLALALARLLDRRSSPASHLVAGEIVLAARKPGGARG